MITGNYYFMHTPGWQLHQGMHTPGGSLTCTVPSCLKSHSLRLLSLAAVSSRSGWGDGLTHRMAPAWSRTWTGHSSSSSSAYQQEQQLAQEQ